MKTESEAEKVARERLEALGLVYYSPRMSAGTDYVTINIRTTSFERICRLFEGGARESK